MDTANLPTTYRHVNRRRWALISILPWLVCSAALGQATSHPKPSVTDPDRNDSFERKIQLLTEARARGDFDVARSLTHSLRDTLLQEQIESKSETNKVTSGAIYSTDDLPAPLKLYTQGWKHCRPLQVRESHGLERKNEPVQISLAFPRELIHDLYRELRVVRIDPSDFVEVPSQVLRVSRSDGHEICEVVWQCDVVAHAATNYLILFDNPHAELPHYPTDLEVRGEGIGLQITNNFFTASLSKQSGQLERLVLRGDHGLELFSGGDGHGEPPGIDWAHDYVDRGNFQKLRVTLWDQPPEYEVFSGPVCTVLRRWGFPRSPIHPIYAPAKLHVDVEYRFYSNLPWFHKLGRMEAIQDMKVAALRDDEWVFSGQSFTDSFWFDQKGEFRLGTVPPEQSESIWGVGFFHRESRDSFAGLFLEHTAQGMPEPKHTGAPTMFYKWHGHVWSRYPLPVNELMAGAVLQQKNAYLSGPFSYPQDVGKLETTYAALKHPVVASEIGLDDLGVDADHRQPLMTTRLARPGEHGDLTRLKDEVWKALRDSKDAQLYTADINVVDLGLVNDVQLHGETLTLRMSMPHPGRPRLGYFTHGSISVHPTLSVPIRERLLKIPGIKNIQVIQSWHPAWNSLRLSNVGRAKLGLDN
jgi:metal-sulfur cluster biosynthetic enzyme